MSRHQLGERPTIRGTPTDKIADLNAALARAMREPERTSTTTEARPVANQTDDLTALGREVSGLNAKVNILMGVQRLCPANHRRCYRAMAGDRGRRDAAHP